MEGQGKAVEEVNKGSERSRKGSGKAKDIGGEKAKDVWLHAWAFGAVQRPFRSPGPSGWRACPPEHVHLD